MKINVDENLPPEIVNDLQGAGYEAESVNDEGLSGAPDPVLLEARAEGHVFLTLDKGIADIRNYPPQQYAGLVVFRPRSLGRTAVLAFVRSYLPVFQRIDPAGRLLVISERGVRVR